MPDLAYEGESWAVIRLRAAKAHTGDGALIDLGSITIRYLDLDGNPHKLAPAGISLPSLPPAAFGAIVEDPLVTQRVRS